ncbi:MAG: gluconokinase [Clostridiales Family XIII bacterium]|jgi:gluconokinase|nr:gluconokinase [Clostridiales Family XIII bacterium]
MDIFIGVDIGTTSTKSVAFSSSGKDLFKSNIEYPLYQKVPEMAEQDPDEIFSAVIESLYQVVAQVKVNYPEVREDDIKLVSFSSAMHSLILLDKNYTPLTNVITWADNRSEKYVAPLKESGKGKEIFLRTGTPIHPMSPLLKLIWLKNDEKELFDKASYFVGIKEYVHYRLTGELKVDYSIASATGLFNLKNLAWDEEALKITGVKETQLAVPVETTYQFEKLREAYAEIIGISDRVPFVIGASDGCLSNLGVNAIKPGEVALTIGTSGAVRVVIDEPRVDENERLFCYALTKDKWVIGGPVNNGGIVFRWIRDTFYEAEKTISDSRGEDVYDVMTQAAANLPAGSEGLICLPFLGGERAPLWDANARGTYFGLTRAHGRDHILRATLEGIVFNLYTVLQAVEETSGKSVSIKATGGFARSSVWRQILSDVFDREVVIPESYESSCLGAVVLGMYGLGIVDSLEVVGDMVGVTNAHKPISQNADVYKELYVIYKNVNELLKTQYRSIAEFQRK